MREHPSLRLPLFTSAVLAGAARVAGRCGLAPSALSCPWDPSLLVT